MPTAAPGPVAAPAEQARNVPASRRDDQPPFRRVAWASDVVGQVLLDQVARGVELIRGLEGASWARPGSARLARPGQRAGRRQLDERGHAQAGHRLHAQVPAHRRGDLGDDALQPLLAGA
jgi:hypothetical protein